MGVQKISWDKQATVGAGDHNVLYGKGNENYQLGTGYVYTTEKYKQLREYSLLAAGCHILF